MRSLFIILLLFALSNAALAQQAPVPNAQVMSEGVPLRLRAGPGLSYAVLDLLDDGTPLVITGRNNDASWLEVITTDEQLPGWVFSNYVATDLDLSAVPVNSSPLNFRLLVSGISAKSRRIYTRGQSLGNQASVFAKVGDSITVSANVFHPIGDGYYTLNSFAYLRPVINFFSPGPAFKRASVAAGVGWNAAAVLLPEFADLAQCHAGEIPLRCEYRLIQPAFALIMFGTNDVGYVPLSTFRHNMERIITISTDMGVVPVLSTIPPRIGYDDEVLTYNQLIRELSREYEIPLWDYGHAMQVYLPNSLTFDGVHPSLPPRGADDAANFEAQNLPYGYVLRNLSALHVLDALWREIVLYEDLS